MEKHEQERFLSGMKTLKRAVTGNNLTGDEYKEINTFLMPILAKGLEEEGEEKFKEFLRSIPGNNPGEPFCSKENVGNMLVKVQNWIKTNPDEVMTAESISLAKKFWKQIRAWVNSMVEFTRINKEKAMKKTNEMLDRIENWSKNTRKAGYQPVKDMWNKEKDKEGKPLSKTMRVARKVDAVVWTSVWTSVKLGVAQVVRFGFFAARKVREGVSKAWGWLRGLFSKKAPAPVAEPVPASV